MTIQPPTDLPGRYVAGSSLLHRLDPRSKLLILVLSVAACFLLKDVSSLVWLAIFFLVLLSCSTIPITRFFRFLISLRYFYIFTLLVYMFFSPGHTLFGVAWLSRDGLGQGLTVCLQLSLALGFSMLVSMTTPPAVLAAGIERLLHPLKRLHVPVELVGDSLQLVMYFVDLLMSRATAAQFRQDATLPFRQRLQSVLKGAADLLEESLAQADALSLKMSRGESLGITTEEAHPLGFRLRDWLCLAGCSVIIALLLGGGR